jgi:DNA-directed RNA polymerase subunit beta
VFDGAKEEEIAGLLEATHATRDGVRLIDGDGKAQLFDGRRVSRSATRSRWATSTS